MKSIGILIVDDEEPARLRLRDLLAEEADVEVLAEVTNGTQAVQAIETLSPDLVFLDIQMPERDGLAVIEAVGPERMPLVILVTAFDRHAIRAFELNALDYLLKPFDDDRFKQTMARVRQRLQLENRAGFNKRLVKMVDQMGNQLTGRPFHSVPRPVRIAVKHRGRLVLLVAEQIDYILADGPYAQIHTAERSYHLRERMNQLEARLSSHQFFRIHRSTLVNLERVASLTPYFRGEYFVNLKNGVQLKLSRARRPALIEHLALLN